MNSNILLKAVCKGLNKTRGVTIRTQEDGTQTVLLDDVEQPLSSLGFDVDGKYAEELELSQGAEVRVKRNAMLQESDSIMHQDRWGNLTKAKQNEWTSYRQALRDVTSQSGFPSSVSWPSKP